MSTHHWISGGTRRSREILRAGLDLPDGLVVDAHRNRRGPYSAAGAILRAVVPGALREQPGLVQRHEVEILTMAPELRSIVPATRETLTSLAVPAERTRFYSRLRTGRLSHGLAEFFQDLAGSPAAPAGIVIENLHAADPTDTELTEILLRRIDPDRIRIVVGTADTTSSSVHASTHRAGPDSRPPTYTAREYVWSDGTLDSPGARDDYDRLTEAERQGLHDERARELEDRDEMSLRLGAVPYHRERGSDPEKRWEAIMFAANTCLDLGLYHATLDLGERGRQFVGWDEPMRRFMLTARMTTSLSILERAPEAEVLYDELRRCTAIPKLHMHAAYATAMLYTRHHESLLKDNDRARAWINQAIAFAGLEPDSRERAFQSVFMSNGLALIEVHAKRPDEALRLVDEGIARLDAELEPGEHLLHRSVLRFNRGQVYAALGRTDEAIADYTAVIEADPNFSEYWFDRAGLLARQGRYAEALDDYANALRVSPPFVEVYYNRGDLLLELGETDAALADFDHVLEIDPAFTDAFVNRAGIRLELGDLDGAQADAVAGLEHDPGNAHLLVVVAQVLAERGDEGARAAFDRALSVDGAPAPAWAGRAAIRFGAGDLEGALADLEQAVALAPDDPATLYNRAMVLRELGEAGRATVDLREALTLAPGDVDIEEALDDLVRAVA